MGVISGGEGTVMRKGNGLLLKGKGRQVQDSRENQMMGSGRMGAKN